MLSKQQAVEKFAIVTVRKEKLFSRLVKLFGGDKGRQHDFFKTSFLKFKQICNLHRDLWFLVRPKNIKFAVMKLSFIC